MYIQSQRKEEKNSKNEYTYYDAKNSLRELLTHDKTQIRYSLIKSVNEASPVEYFWHYIAPKIEKDILVKLRSSISALSDKDQRQLKLSQILGYINRKREEERYYSQ